jgi:hypothetical protein
MTHIFKIGEAVKYSAPGGIFAPGGVYIVTTQLPERDGHFEYRIRHSSEPHERLAREGDLSAPAAPAASPDSRPKARSR